MNEQEIKKSSLNRDNLTDDDLNIIVNLKTLNDKSFNVISTVLIEEQLTKNNFNIDHILNYKPKLTYILSKRNTTKLCLHLLDSNDLNYINKFTKQIDIPSVFIKKLFEKHLGNNNNIDYTNFKFVKNYSTHFNRFKTLFINYNKYKNIYTSNVDTKEFIQNLIEFKSSLLKTDYTNINDQFNKDIVIDSSMDNVKLLKTYVMLSLLDKNNINNYNDTIINCVAKAINDLSNNKKEEELCFITFKTLIKTLISLNIHQSTDLDTISKLNKNSVEYLNMLFFNKLSSSKNFVNFFESIENNLEIKNIEKFTNMLGSEVINFTNNKPKLVNPYFVKEIEKLKTKSNLYDYLIDEITSTRNKFGKKLSPDKLLTYNEKHQLYKLTESNMGNLTEKRKTIKI